MDINEVKPHKMTSKFRIFKYKIKLWEVKVLLGIQNIVLYQLQRVFSSERLKKWCYHATSKDQGRPYVNIKGNLKYYRSYTSVIMTIYFINLWKPRTIK